MNLTLNGAKGQRDEGATVQCEGAKVRRSGTKSGGRTVLSPSDKTLAPSDRTFAPSSLRPVGPCLIPAPDHHAFDEFFVFNLPTEHR